MKKKIDRAQVDQVTRDGFAELYELQKNPRIKMNQFDGESEENEFGDFTTTQIVEKARLKKPVVLDIGSGIYGGVPRNLREKFEIEAFGILGPTDVKLPDYLHVADAHFLSQEQRFSSIEFDFIFSNMAFLHFFNPIQALQEAYLKLKTGGILLVNQLIIPGLSSVDFSLMLEDMKKQGYKITYLARSGIPYMDLSTFVIQKIDSKPTLSFPLEITDIGNKDDEDRKATYSLTKLLPCPEEKGNDIYDSIKLNLKGSITFALVKIMPSYDKIKKFISLEEIFRKLLPLANLLNPLPLSESNPLLLNVYHSISASNKNYLQGFLHIFSIDHPLRKEGYSLDNFVEALMFVAHQDILSYKGNLKFNEEAVAMGLPAPEKSHYSETDSILKKLMTTDYEALQKARNNSISPVTEIKKNSDLMAKNTLQNLIFDNQYWVPISHSSFSVPDGIKEMQNFIKKQGKQEITLPDLKDIIMKRPENGSKRYHFFTHKRSGSTENLYTAIKNASSWENLLNSKEFQAVLKDRENFHQSLKFTIPYSP